MMCQVSAYSEWRLSLAASLSRVGRRAIGDSCRKKELNEEKK